MCQSEHLCSEKYGKVCGFYGASTPVVILADIDIIKQVFIAMRCIAVYFSEQSYQTTLSSSDSVSSMCVLVLKQNNFLFRSYNYFLPADRPSVFWLICRSVKHNFLKRTGSYTSMLLSEHLFF